MRKADSSRLETLEALIAEKRKHETHLAKLEERRAATPEQVFNRLRDEYLTKLTDAQVRAAAEAESLSGGLEDDEAAVVEVEAKLVALEEERAEAQIRAEVEEWDPKEAQKKLTAMNAAISMAEKERDARKTVAERTRALLAEARGGTPPRPQASVPGAPPMRPTTAGIAGGPNFDELAFLNSVVGRTSTSGVPAPRASKPVSQPAEAKEPPAANPELPPSIPPSPAPPPPAAAAVPEPAPATAPEPTPTPEPPAQSSLPLEAPSAPTPVAKAAEPEPTAPAADAEDEEEASGPLGRPTPRTTQAVKTLKCAECGSMNYPTEWYCERCGGELAAL
ncbi:MAG: hypothetical protein KF689_07300 [Gemmatimonadaceae bacterium]|nr:hypothetical protein [Gemmatimonadaceae bacterium]MCW5825023.1 hypothetical protein [Gemmatimonadaceae bacterium]